MKKVIHKSRERSIGGYWQVYYGGYLANSTHMIPCGPSEGEVNISFWWKNVTCKQCLKMRTK